MAYDKFRYTLKDKDAFRFVCCVNKETNKVVDWLDVINGVLQKNGLTAINMDLKGSGVEPLAALLSVKGGPDQGYHRDFSHDRLAELRANGQPIPHFIVVACQDDTRLKYIPGSHLPGQGPDSVRYNLLSELEKVQYLDSIARVVHIKVGEMYVFHGGLMHAGMGYMRKFNVRMHAFASEQPFNGTESEVRLFQNTWTQEEYNEQRLAQNMRPYAPPEPHVQNSALAMSPFEEALKTALVAKLKSHIGVDLVRVQWGEGNYNAIRHLLANSDCDGDTLPRPTNISFMNKGKRKTATVVVGSQAWLHACKATIVEVAGHEPRAATAKTYLTKEDKIKRTFHQWIETIVPVPNPKMCAILDTLGFVEDWTAPKTKGSEAPVKVTTPKMVRKGGDLHNLRGNGDRGPEFSRRAQPRKGFTNLGWRSRTSRKTQP